MINCNIGQTQTHDGGKVPRAVYVRTPHHCAHSVIHTNHQAPLFHDPSPRSRLSPKQDCMPRGMATSMLYLSISSSCPRPILEQGNPQHAESGRRDPSDTLAKGGRTNFHEQRQKDCEPSHPRANLASIREKSGWPSLGQRAIYDTGHDYFRKVLLGH